MKVYIAGPMTGLPDFNYPAFFAAEKELRELGHEPINPARAEGREGCDYIPAGAGFMGKAWDAFVPPVAVWDECLRVLKPGGHVLAFAGSRTHDLMTLGLRLAGFDIRDSVAWLYGSGFPKSLDVSKAIDKAAGAEREVVGIGQYANRGRRTDNAVYSEATPSDLEVITAPATPDAERWQGWGTALKPAFEPIVVARKPLAGTVAANVLAHGTGALNIDGCRVATDGETFRAPQSDPSKRGGVVGSDLGISGASLDRFQEAQRASIERTATLGRWPANVVLDGYREPVLRLRYNLPTEVERTIRESFGARTDHLPAVRDERDGAAESGRAPEVLLAPVSGGLDVAEPDGRSGAALREAAHTRVDREDAGEHAQPVGSVESSLEGRHVPHPGIRDGQSLGAVAGGSGPLLVDGADESVARELRPRASAGGGPDAGPTTPADGARAPRERSQGRQSAGESRGALRGGAQEDARRGGAGAAAPATGERGAEVGPLDVLRSECPPGWWHYFDVVAHRQSQAEVLDEQSGETRNGGQKRSDDREPSEIGQGVRMHREFPTNFAGDSGGASRFFYVAKADASERVRVDGIAHPTVKPLSLMRWLVRLVTPPGGTVLEPFAGSGTTVEACLLEGFRCIAIEREADYLPLIRQRIARRRDPVEAVRGAGEELGLFDLLEEETA